MLSRRQLVRGGIAAASAALLWTPARPGRSATLLAPTPRQPTGPFYPVSLPLEHDNDLVRVAGQSIAPGDIVHVEGTVRTTAGEAVAGARVEIWQCDAGGHYHHPGDRGGTAADPRFQGYGATDTAGTGAYSFRTLHPVPYTGRTPHIHVMVNAPGIRRLVTQLYVAGAPGNERDGLFSRLDATEQARLLVSFERADDIEPAARRGRFDIVVEPDSPA